MSITSYSICIITAASYGFYVVIRVHKHKFHVGFTILLKFLHRTLFLLVDASLFRLLKVMTFDDALLRSLSTIMPVNEAGRIFEALNSDSSLENDEHLDTFSGSDVLDSTGLGRYSTSRVSTHLQNHRNFTPEPYVSLAMPFPSDDLTDVSSSGDVFSQLRRAREEDTDFCKTNAQSNRDSPQESRVKELLECNPPLQTLVNKHTEQIQSQQQILHSVPQLKGIEMEIPNQGTRVLVHDRSNQRETYTNICSQRLKQYFFDMRNNIHVSYLFLDLRLLFASNIRSS